jgi:hypothetical protein
VKGYALDDSDGRLNEIEVSDQHLYSCTVLRRRWCKRMCDQNIREQKVLEGGQYYLIARRFIFELVTLNQVLEVRGRVAKDLISKFTELQSP